MTNTFGIKCQACGTIHYTQFETLTGTACNMRAVCPQCCKEWDDESLWEDSNFVSAAMTPHHIETEWFISKGNSVGAHSDYFPQSFSVVEDAEMHAMLVEGLNPGSFTIWCYDADGNVVTAN